MAAGDNLTSVTCQNLSLNFQQGGDRKNLKHEYSHRLKRCEYGHREHEQYG